MFFWRLFDIISRAEGEIFQSHSVRNGDANLGDHREAAGLNMCVKRLFYNLCAASLLFSTTCAHWFCNAELH